MWFVSNSLYNFEVTHEWSLLNGPSLRPQTWPLGLWATPENFHTIGLGNSEEIEHKSTNTKIVNYNKMQMYMTRLIILIQLEENLHGELSIAHHDESTVDV